MLNKFLLQFFILFCGFIIIESTEENIHKLFETYRDWKLETNPTYATKLGFSNYTKNIEDKSPDGIQKTRANCEYFRQQAINVSTESVNNTRETFFLKILEREANDCIKSIDQKNYLFADVGFLKGIQNDSPHFFGEENILKWDTFEDYQNVIQRMKKVPIEIDQIIQLLKLGVQEKITYANESLSRLKDQFEKIQVNSPEDSDFYRQFKTMADNLKMSPDLPIIKETQEEVKEIIANEILPAFKDLQLYIENEYMNHLRPSPGLSGVPGGLEMYKGLLEFHTSISGITPEEIHQIGLDEIKELNEKLSKLISNLGYHNLSTRDFFQKIRNEQKQQFSSKDEIIQYFKDQVQKINLKLDTVFGSGVLQPEILEVNVKPSPSDRGPFAYYQLPSVDGRRKGTFYVTLDNVARWKRYETMSLSLHETNPGHNLQTGYKRLSKLPPFLKDVEEYWFNPDGFNTNTAFTEGWGLYCEFLGHEMKLYEDDPFQLVGFYSFNLLRAARLVVDTGLHAYEWSRQDAIDYLMDNTALSEQTCIGEVDRYITLPGQATSYKIGERKIKAIRSKFETELLDDFDIRDFHESVLECLGPLDLLEECVRDYLRILKPKTTGGLKATRSTVQNGVNNNHLSMSILTAAMISKFLY